MIKNNVKKSTDNTVPKKMPPRPPGGEITKIPSKEPPNPPFKNAPKNPQKFRKVSEDGIFTQSSPLIKNVPIKKPPLTTPPQLPKDQDELEEPTKKLPPKSVEIPRREPNTEHQLQTIIENNEETITEENKQESTNTESPQSSPSKNESSQKEIAPSDDLTISENSEPVLSEDKSNEPELSEEEKKALKMKKQLDSILSEIVQSERGFCKDVEILIQVNSFPFIKRTNKSNKKHFSKFIKKITPKKFFSKKKKFLI